MNSVKILPRNTVCALFEIRAPIWLGNKDKRTVGLALNRVRKHNEIHFTYRNKSGELSMPDPYYLDGDMLKGLDYEVQVIKGTTLVLVPIKDLDFLIRE